MTYLKDLKPDEVAVLITQAIREKTGAILARCGGDIRWKPESEDPFFQAALNLTVFAQTGQGLTPDQFMEAKKKISDMAKNYSQNSKSFELICN